MNCSIDNFPKNISITISKSDIKDLFVQDHDLRASQYDNVYVAPKSGYFENPRTNEISHISDAFNQAKQMWKNQCPCLSNTIDTLPLVIDNQYPEDAQNGRPFAFINSGHPMVLNVEAHWIPKVTENSLWPGVLFHEISHVLEHCTGCFGDINKKIKEDMKSIHKIVQSALRPIAQQATRSVKKQLTNMLDNYFKADPDFAAMSSGEQRRISIDYNYNVLWPLMTNNLDNIIGIPFRQSYAETRTYIRHFFCPTSSDIFAANYFQEMYKIGIERWLAQKNALDPEKRKEFFESMDYGENPNAQGGIEKVEKFLDHFISSNSLSNALVIPVKNAMNDILKGTIAEPSKVCDLTQYYNCPDGDSSGSDLKITLDLKYVPQKDRDFGDGKPVPCLWQVGCEVNPEVGDGDSSSGGCCKQEKSADNSGVAHRQTMILGYLELCLACEGNCIYNFEYSDIVTFPHTGKMDFPKSFDSLLSDTNITTMLFGCPSGAHHKDADRRFQISDELKTRIMRELSSYLRSSALGGFTAYLKGCEEAVKAYNRLK